jgi:hypothetical protein
VSTAVSHHSNRDPSVCSILGIAMAAAKLT